MYFYGFIAVMVTCFGFASSVAAAGETVDISFSAQAARIQDRIGSLLSADARWMLVAADVGTGNNLINAGNGGNDAFIPGSLVKMFVTAAVLDRNARHAVNMETVAALNGEVNKNVLQGEVVLKGGGNPFLSTRDLREAVEKIRLLGIEEITGDVIVDDTLFDTTGWNNRYEGPAYGVPSALGLDMHTVSITIEEGGRVVVDPPNDAVRVDINPAGKPDIRRINDLTYAATGAEARPAVVHKRFALVDPAIYAGGTLLTLLRRTGIQVHGVVKRGALSARPGRTIRFGARDISEVVRDTNQESLNVAADNLLLLLGSDAFGPPGTKAKGLRAAHDFLRDMGVATTGSVIDDGSGISERNRITPRQAVVFLLAASGRSWFPAFFESLSRPGTDGRLRNLGYRSERMRMKTGQVRDAYCFAGYADRNSGGRTAFAFMLNGPDANVSTSQSAAVEALKAIAE